MQAFLIFFLLTDRSLKNISEAAGRYALFKVGPVLSASHGIGAASMSVIMHEVKNFVLVKMLFDQF